jgi:hypothetical protein
MASHSQTKKQPKPKPKTTKLASHIKNHKNQPAPAPAVATTSSSIPATQPSPQCYSPKDHSQLSVPLSKRTFERALNAAFEQNLARVQQRLAKYKEYGITYYEGRTCTPPRYREMRRRDQERERVEQEWKKAMAAREARFGARALRAEYKAEVELWKEGQGKRSKRKGKGKGKGGFGLKGRWFDRGDRRTSRLDLSLRIWEWRRRELGGDGKMSREDHSLIY